MKKNLIIFGVIVVAFVLGLLMGGNGSKPESQMETHDHASMDTKEQTWTCSMHPQIRMPEPGQCPICGMDLIPASIGDDDTQGKRELKLSPTAIKLAEIQTAEVERKYIPIEIRMVGKVTYDETRLGYITAWVPGRIDRLYVDYTGITVRKGDHMAYLYSPDLLTAQEELLQAQKAVNELKNSSMKIMRDTARDTLKASQEKLRLWGLTQNQIANVQKQGRPTDHITIYAPMGGIVIQKDVQEGSYVKTGTRLYTIADLSHLWIKLDAYESDLVWLRYGQEVEIETEAYPGETFKGTIAFIDPVLNTMTRTVKVRVNVNNLKGQLKPEMFVRTIVRARVAQSGRVMDEAFAGKWICPMHPDVVKENAGSCDICEMPLARSETLGYAAAINTEDDMAPLVIPASAPLITGKRAIVYVAHPEKRGVFEGREITLGPRAGDCYMVKDGLQQGEQVVMNGNFKIDSALQIMAKPSMMNPEGGVVMTGHAHHGDVRMPEKAVKPEDKHDGRHGTKTEKIEQEQIQAPEAFRKQIDDVLTAYYHIQEALSTDDEKAAQTRSDKLLKALEKVDMGLLKGHSHMIWMKDLGDLTKQAKALKTTSDIQKQRELFYLLSESITSVVKKFGTGGKHGVLQFHCPMAFGNRGANWLQSKRDVENPYFGKMMFKCGKITETLVEPQK